MLEPSISDFIFIEEGPALPPASCRTLDRIDEEKRVVFERMRERFRERGVEVEDHNIEAAWPSYVDSWLFDETAVVARALSLHVNSPASFYLDPADPLVLSVN